MKQSIKKYILISQLCLLLDLAICLILIPHFLFARNEGGMSNYGIHLKTVIPYSLGFLLAAFFVIRAALTIKNSSASLRRLRRLLICYFIILLLILISTYGYKTNIYLKDTHIVVTIATFWFELLSALWLCWVFLRDKMNIFLLVCQFIGLIIGSLTFFGSLHLLFTSQLITIITFGAILVRSSGQAVNEKI
jgi:hypothetical protein